MSTDCVNVWQLLLDLTSLCEECQGSLKVSSPIIAGEATARCIECDTWYRYRVADGQIHHRFLRRLKDQSVQYYNVY